MRHVFVKSEGRNWNTGETGPLTLPVTISVSLLLQQKALQKANKGAARDLERTTCQTV